MEFRHRGFAVVVKDDHGVARALVLDPVNPRRFHSLSGRDRDEAANLARAYVDGLCTCEVDRVLGSPASDPRQLPEDPKPMILVVDDHPATRKALVRLLNLSGWSAEGASDGHEALQALRERSRQLVILDWMMPGLDGADVLRSMASEGMLERTPVVVYSAIGGEDTRDRALELGAKACLKKSAPLIELFTAVEEYVPAGPPPAREPSAGSESL